MATEYHWFDAITKSGVSYDILFCYITANLEAEWKAYIVESR